MRRKLNSPNVIDVEVQPIFPEEMEHPRPIPPTVRIWAPDGHSEVHTRFNAADLCRRPGPGQAPWSYSPPVKEDAVPPEEVDPETGARRARRADAPSAPPAPPSELQLLRAQAAALGITIDATWGKKKLRDEIAAASPAPGDMDADPENVDTFSEHGDDMSI